MDRLGFLGHTSDEAEVDALLSQLNDEHLMKLKVNIHSKYNKYPTVVLGSGKWSHADDDDGVLDSELSKRLENLKVAPLKQPSTAPKNKGKQTETKKQNSGVPSLGRSSSRREDGSGGDGSDGRRLSRSQSHNPNSDFLSSRSSGGGRLDDSEDIDANLMVRFSALKGNPSPNSLDANSLVQSSGHLSSAKGASKEYYSSSYGSSSSPSVTLLGRSSSRSSPRVMTTSVATSCHCSTPSPFKLLKQLSSKKIPSNPADLPSSPSSGSSAAPSIQSTTSKKSDGKESCSKKKSHHNRGEAEVEAENLSTVKDVRRLLSVVADRVGLERNRILSAEEEDGLSGDVQEFSMLDREQEYLNASSEEKKLNYEVERVVEWAKDAARLGLDTSDGEKEDLELGEDDLELDSSIDKHVKSAKGLKKATKTKKHKKWGLF